MEHIRVLTLSIVQLNGQDTPSLHLRAAIDGEPDREVSLRTDMEPVHFSNDLTDWVRMVLMAAVGEL